ncbi:MAG: hypothetical protein CVU16_04485 [Betaproteobacteria bacterium HGW-Betaproteobacteria-10]|nr:MAG: hypothetical protein CVU16_04485 [Betaproteobacteria bacterium HGW-Betaproteobacteria-10]
MFKVPLTALLLALTANGAFAAGEFYCCADPTNGRRICADTLPEQCRARAYRILDSGGNLLKEVGPPLTAEQKAELTAAARQAKQREDIAREQRRKDQALLDTYASPQDIDLAQNKAETDVKLAIQDTQARIDEARSKRKKAEAEAEFYRKKSMPAELAKELRTLEHEIRIQQELLAVKKREFDAVKTKYDADRQRYYEVTKRTPMATPSNGAARSSQTR